MNTAIKLPDEYIRRIDEYANKNGTTRLQVVLGSLDDTFADDELIDDEYLSHVQKIAKACETSEMKIHSMGETFN